jgi:hypothetical protein
MKKTAAKYWGLLAITLFAVSGTDSHADSICEKWFLGTGAEPGNADCEMNCITAGVGMDSFMCHGQCRDLCKSYLDRLTVEQLTVPYELTEAEKTLIQKHPKEAVAVFYSKYLSEKATDRIFGAFPKRNNEADAFRHYVWSGRIAHSIGEQKARLFLDAHESDPDDPKEEKQMDLHNNERGLRQGVELDQKKQFSSESLEKAALQSLHDKTLKVIRPTGNIPEWK